MKPNLHVCAAVILREGHYFLATRKPGSHLAGYWEFPGGKCEPGETCATCIQRELQEELSWDITCLKELFQITTEQPERTICLHFMLCKETQNSRPVPLEGQQIGWFTPQEASSLNLAPADREALEKLSDASEMP